MDIYAQLLDLLAPKNAPGPPALFATLAAVSPLTITIRDTQLQKGLFYPAGTVFRPEDVGRELLVLPCEEGIYLAGFVEGGTL